MLERFSPFLVEDLFELGQFKGLLLLQPLGFLGAIVVLLLADFRNEGVVSLVDLANFIDLFHPELLIHCILLAPDLPHQLILVYLKGLLCSLLFLLFPLFWLLWRW